MTKIDQIWEELDNDSSFRTGLIIRRYSSDILPEIFVALNAPEKIRCLAVYLGSVSEINLISLNKLRDIRIELIPDDSNALKNILLISLTNNHHKDIFSTLCEDLIKTVSSLKEEKTLVKVLLNRFEKWKSLFENASSAGLSPEEQRGLYGELYFLSKWLINSVDKRKCVEAWFGPEKRNQDFQHGDWALEVKTTTGNNHQKIHISNERQLDTSNLNDLILYHLSIDVRTGSGVTLISLVESLHYMLETDAHAEIIFAAKLLEAGFFAQHKYLYDTVSYFIRQENFYKIENEFPRIEEKDIRSGVGDVKYSVIVTSCSDYIINENIVFKIIN
jgi:hypothetical protein